jgi:pimeloyl-ACP methyl ester carboxylesterase
MGVVRMTVTTTATAARMAYGEAGAGDPALLFVPGWCGDRTVFDGLVARGAEHRRVIAVDLPEHGESPRTGADFGADDVVRSVVGLVDELGVERVVPVGLSHAGWTAIALRRALGPARVPGVVLADWMVLGPPPGFLDALAALQDEHAWELVRSGLFEMWTTDVDVPALHDYVAGMAGYGREHWARAGREIAAGFAAEGTPLAALDRLAPPCPTLHVYAQPADDEVLAAQQSYAAERSWLQVRRLDARSHFPMFEVAAAPRRRTRHADRRCLRHSRRGRGAHSGRARRR